MQSLSRSIWAQRTISIMNAAAVGVIADQQLHHTLWGVSAALLAAILLIWVVSKPPIWQKALKLELDVAMTLRTIVLSLLFFIFCAIAAYSIVS